MSNRVNFGGKSPIGRRLLTRDCIGYWVNVACVVLRNRRPDSGEVERCVATRRGSHFVEWYSARRVAWLGERRYQLHEVRFSMSRVQQTYNRCSQKWTPTRSPPSTHFHLPPSTPSTPTCAQSCIASYFLLTTCLTRSLISITDFFFMGLAYRGGCSLLRTAVVYSLATIPYPRPLTVSEATE
jgi:hypothetical protein